MILLLSKQLRSYGKQHPSTIQSHINIVSHNLTILNSQDDPDHDDHQSMRAMTMKNIRHLELALARERVAIKTAE